jgi:hypothetical protein
MWTGVKLVQLGIWGWAAVSKFGEWFPFVVQTMICNSMLWPLTRKDVHRAMFRNHPTDLRCSTLCYRLAHFGTFQEILFPCLLCFGGAGLRGDWMGQIGLYMAFAFHFFIFTQIAMGAPQAVNPNRTVAHC